MVLHKTCSTLGTTGTYRTITSAVSYETHGSWWLFSSLWPHETSANINVYLARVLAPTPITDTWDSQPDRWSLMCILTVNGDMFIVIVVYDGAGNFVKLPGMFLCLFMPDIAHWCPPALLCAWSLSLAWSHHCSCMPAHAWTHPCASTMVAVSIAVHATCCWDAHTCSS